MRFRSLLLVALLAGSASAQTVDAAILGSVRATDGAVVADASVSAKNIATGVEWSVRTTSTGRFAFLQLPLGGPYRLTARHVGFRSETRDGYLLTLGQRIVVDLALSPAPTDLAPVVVTAMANDRRAASMGGNFHVDGAQIAAVPAVNRNFTDLAALAPTTGVQSSLLGQRWTSTDIRVDGAQAKNMLRSGELR